MARRSLFVPLNCIAEVREITRNARITDRSAMTSSVSPSAKNSLSGSGLRLPKGRTAIEGRGLNGGTLRTGTLQTRLP